MLPSLTLTFLAGLVLGSQISYYPIVLSCGLAGTALGATLYERAGRLDSRRAALLYASVLCGVLYWTISTPLPSFYQLEENHREITPIDVSGRVVAPVQHAPGRQTAV